MINHLPAQKNRQMIATAPAIESQTQSAVHQPLPNWQVQLNQVITDIYELLKILELDDYIVVDDYLIIDDHTHANDKPSKIANKTYNKTSNRLYIPKNFGLRVPKGFVSKMKKGDINDPLLRQVLPSLDETITVTGFITDPLAEQQHNPIKGLLHKYESRVLVTVTGACAIHCRYCFRQHFDYQANMPNQQQLAHIKKYIESNPDINEVILSGGDPLSVSNRRLFNWLDTIESLPQIKTIRLHTRLPIVIPERLDDDLLARLERSHCQIVIVVHTNHANEIDDNTQMFLQKTKQHGIVLLNQVVLLKGINDNVQTQVALSQRLFEAGVLPYYLHILDKVAGAAHYNVSGQQAIKLYWEMLEKLPGYLVPKLVQELPNKPFKTPIDIYRKV